MDKTIPFPEGYRYTSDIELFKAAVDCAKEMIKKGKMIILYQFVDEVMPEVFISPEEFEEENDKIGWNDFIDILNDEIIYVLRQNFENSVEKDRSLKDYLKEKDVPEEWQKKIVELRLDKCRYVDEHLGGEREKNRYNLKKCSFLKKVSDMDYGLSRTIDEEEILYATIRMSVNSTLEGKDVPEVIGNMFNQHEENITFICDKSDIEYLIHKLQRIKQRL